MKLWRETSGQAQSRWQLAGWLLAFAFPVFALVVDKAASTIYAIFFLAGLWLLSRGRFERPDPRLRWVLIAFAAYFLVGVLSFFLGEQTRLGEKLLGRDIRFLAALPVCFVMLRLRPSRLLIVSGLAAGGAVAGLVAWMQVVADAAAGVRAEGETISILFGHLCAALLLVNLVFAVRERNAWRWLAWAGALGALAGMLLSATRGAVLAVVVVGGVLVVMWGGLWWRRWAALLLAAAATAPVLILTPLADNLGARFEEGLADVQRRVQAKAFLENFDWPQQAPACLDSPALLDWMVESQAVRTSGSIDVLVVKNDPTFAMADDTCTGRAFLRIRNSGASRATARLPERSVPRNAASGGVLLVRGEGQLRLAGDHACRMTVKTQVPQRAVLEGGPTNRTRHVVALDPDQYMDVVFIESWPGEYRFIDGMNAVNSRAYMWRAAFDAFVHAPVLGRGTGAFPVVLEDSAASGQSPWQIARYDHAHSEMLTVAAERGVIGLITLFAVYAAPFWLFRRRHDAFGWAGMALTASFFISGLTETIFNHSLGITYYCVLVLLLATAAREPPAAASRTPE
ncbi:MAG TPA: O-antigen ligase family protein [Gammaproteobacteria bacterium]